MSNLYKLKTLIPMEEIEPEAQQQIYALLNMDFVKVLAIMPDVHMGYLMPIGGVGLFDNVISPYCIGFDQHCGMSNIITDKKFGLYEHLKEDVYNEIKEKIPTGFKHHSKSHRDRELLAEEIILEHFEIDDSAPDIEFLNKK